MTKYIVNEEGGVQSVTDEHFEDVLHEPSEDSGRRYLKHGWKEISESEARALHPQLFGKADPQITYSAKELNDQLQRQRNEAEVFGYEPHRSEA